MSYTNVFGGTTIYPSDVSYLPLALTDDVELEWPMESSGTLDPAARIIDVTPDAAGYAIVMPDATLTGAGQTVLFNNLSGSDAFYVKDNAGGALATVAAGEQWQLYLAATGTAAGTWRVFRFGASTATVQPSALAGYGLTVTGTQLSQSLPVNTFSTSGTTVAGSNRASAFVWTGGGSGTLNLPAAAGVGNNFFVFVRNEGGGDLTVDPAGAELINSASTLVFSPGDSATVITDGAEWYTVGFGQDAVFAFDYTSISVTGGTYTLSGSELNRIAYKFVGVLVSDVYIIVPATVQQYWVNNATTGSFNFYIKTASGASEQVNQGSKGIYYCDGSGVILASDPTSFALPVTIAQGGTGATTAPAARLNIGITAFADPICTATTGAGVRTVIDAAKLGANSDITSLSALSTPLTVAQGGTGAATLTGYVKGAGTSALTASAAIPVADLTGTLPVANGGTGQTSYTDGQLLIGNTGTGGVTKATLTQGAGISITNGGGSITIAATATGLTNWTEAVNTSAPNATVPVVSFTATNAATDVDAALVPKGAGAVLAQVSDGTATGGNKRGANAVDLQTLRAAAANVASGANSVVLGGENNTASGQYSIAGGNGSTASSTYAVAFGTLGTASAFGSAVHGGYSNTADGHSSAVIGGYKATARGIAGAMVEGSGKEPVSATVGSSQRRRFVLGRQTTSATPTVVATDSTAVNTSNQIVLPNNSAFYFRGEVIANVTGGGNTKGWFIEGVIKRGIGAASTALVGTATVTSNYADAGAAAWALAVTADTTNGCLRLEVTGAAATTIRWVAAVNTTEVTY